jgi:hypothetical protein
MVVIKTHLLILAMMAALIPTSSTEAEQRSNHGKRPPTRTTSSVSYHPGIYSTRSTTTSDGGRKRVENQCNFSRGTLITRDISTTQIGPEIMRGTRMATTKKSSGSEIGYRITIFPNHVEVNAFSRLMPIGSVTVPVYNGSPRVTLPNGRQGDVIGDARTIQKLQTPFVALQRTRNANPNRQISPVLYQDVISAAVGLLRRGGGRL